MVRNSALKWLLESKAGVLVSHYTFQGTLYMERRELFFKVFFEVVVLTFLVLLFLSLKIEAIYSLAAALILAHTCNWLFNGHLFVLGRYLGFTRTKPVKFIEYPEGIKRRLARRKSIQAVAFFGSLSRSGFSPTSDLDMRVISNSNGFCGFMACFWTFLERSIALFHKYPLDVYVIGKKESLLRMRQDEHPVILFDKTGYFSSIYGSYQEYTEFKKDFLDKYVGKE